MSNDFDISTFIITKGGEYIPVSEYDDRHDGEGMFVMLTNDMLNPEFSDDNSICIYRDTLNAMVMSKGLSVDPCNITGIALPWQIEQKPIPDNFKLNAYTDDIGIFGSQKTEDCIKGYLDGYRTNQELMRNVVPLLGERTIDEYLPAMMTAWHTRISYGGRNIHGYLPAIGQMMFISANIKAINDSLRKIDSENVRFKLDRDENLYDAWWSSTEFNDSRSWVIQWGTGTAYDKETSRYVLPIFSI